MNRGNSLGLSVAAGFLLTASVAIAESVSLLGSNILSSVSVGAGVTQTNTFTGIDVHDSANMLVLAIPGESADVISASFGGTSMTLTKSFVQSVYAKVRFFTLSDPNTAPGQTLILVASNPTLSGGYSPQLYAFSNVEWIGDTPQAGAAGAATVTLDFGAVTNNSYLLITAVANGTGNLSFEAPAIDLTGPINGNGGWEGRTAGESISADAGIKTVDVTSAQRVAAIGLELLPVASASGGAGTFVYTK